MKRVVLISLMSALALSSAFAADMPVKVLPHNVAVAAAPSVSGFYVGANFGAAISQQSYQFITIPGASSTKLFPAGAMGGLTVGFGGNVGGAYLGAEGEFDYDFTAGESACNFGGVSTRCGAKNSYLLTQGIVLGIPLSAITGLAGKAQPTGLTPPSQWPIPIALPTNLSVGNLMPFTKFGIAERNVSAYLDPTGTLPVAPSKTPGYFGGSTGSETMVGWMVGGGVKMPIAVGWNAKVEYDLIGFNKSFTPTGGNANLFNPATFKQVNEQRAIFGIDYSL